MSKILKVSGALCAAAAVAFICSGTNLDQNKVDQALKDVPSDKRATVADRAVHNQCDILNAELVGPCQQARVIMEKSSFLFAYKR